MYQAIYRRYRPMTFDEVIGQDDVTEVLKSQVDQARLGHAYIFTGTRGTGKTSCAKIMARAVNCLEPINGNPCNECTNCQAIIDQTTMDVVEMDAASNRRIDDIRELRDQVFFPPARLNYKVYIIDEAHMITKEGFNALLKIMEEPPDHLIFILATTEIEKIPQTILSRCQRYDFKRIDREGIAQSIRLITNDLGVDIEEEAVSLIARSADGALRDAQSLLDQVLAAAEGEVTADLVAASIGSVQAGDVFDLVERIIDEDEEGALGLAVNIMEASGSHELIKSLTVHFEALIIGKTAPDRLEGMDKERVQAYVSQGQRLSLGQLADSIDLLIDYEDRLKKSSQTSAIGLLAVSQLIRMRDRKNLIARLDGLERRLAKLEEGAPPAIQASKDPSQARPQLKASSQVPSPDLQALDLDPRPQSDGPELDQAGPEKGAGQQDFVQQADSGPGKDVFEAWPDLVSHILAAKPPWSIWLNNLRPASLDGDRLVLAVDGEEETKAKMAKDNLQELEERINDYLASDFRLTLEKFADEGPGQDQTKEDKLRDLFGDKINFK